MSMPGIILVGQKGAKRCQEPKRERIGYRFDIGRPTRSAPGGWVYQVLNRANARMPIFTKDEDFAAIERMLEEAVARTGTRLLSYCLMGNHWHPVVWLQEDDELSRFVGWLTLTHAKRWHAHRKSTGSGDLYQGRFEFLFRVQASHVNGVTQLIVRMLRAWTFPGVVWQHLTREGLCPFWQVGREIRSMSFKETHELLATN